MMKRDQQRVRALLADTVVMLCRSGLAFQHHLSVQGLLAVTVDEQDIFVVHIDRHFGDSVPGELADNSSSHVDKPDSNRRPEGTGGASGGAQRGGEGASQIPNETSKPGRDRLSSSGLAPPNRQTFINKVSLSTCPKGVSHEGLALREDLVSSKPHCVTNGGADEKETVQLKPGNKSVGGAFGQNSAGSSFKNVNAIASENLASAGSVSCMLPGVLEPSGAEKRSDEGFQSSCQADEGAGVLEAQQHDDLLQSGSSLVQGKKYTGGLIQGPCKGSRVHGQSITSLISNNLNLSNHMQPGDQQQDEARKSACQEAGDPLSCHSNKAVRGGVAMRRIVRGRGVRGCARGEREIEGQSHLTVNEIPQERRMASCKRSMDMHEYSIAEELTGDDALRRSSGVAVSEFSIVKQSTSSENLVADDTAGQVEQDTLAVSRCGEISNAARSKLFSGESKRLQGTLSECNSVSASSGSNPPKFQTSGLLKRNESALEPGLDVALSYSEASSSSSALPPSKRPRVPPVILKTCKTKEENGEHTDFASPRCPQLKPLVGFIPKLPVAPPRRNARKSVPNACRASSLAVRNSSYNDALNVSETCRATQEVSAGRLAASALIQCNTEAVDTNTQKPGTDTVRTGAVKLFDTGKKSVEMLSIDFAASVADYRDIEDKSDVVTSSNIVHRSSVKQATLPDDYDSIRKRLDLNVSVARQGSATALCNRSMSLESLTSSSIPTCAISSSVTPMKQAYVSLEQCPAVGQNVAHLRTDVRHKEVVARALPRLKHEECLSRSTAKIHPNDAPSHLSVKLKPERERFEPTSVKIQSEVDTTGEAHKVGVIKEVVADNSNGLVHMSSTSLGQSQAPKIASDTKFTPAAISACVARMFSVMKSDSQVAPKAGSAERKTKLNADELEMQKGKETQDKGVESAIETISSSELEKRSMVEQSDWSDGKSELIVEHSTIGDRESRMSMRKPGDGGRRLSVKSELIGTGWALEKEAVIGLGKRCAKTELVGNAAAGLTERRSSTEQWIKPLGAKAEQAPSVSGHKSGCSTANGLCTSGGLAQTPKNPLRFQCKYCDTKFRHSSSMFAHRRRKHFAEHAEAARRLASQQAQRRARLLGRPNKQKPVRQQGARSTATNNAETNDIDSDVRKCNLARDVKGKLRRVVADGVSIDEGAMKLTATPNAKRAAAGALKVIKVFGRQGAGLRLCRNMARAAGQTVGHISSRSVCQISSQTMRNNAGYGAAQKESVKNTYTRKPKVKAGQRLKKQTDVRDDSSKEVMASSDQSCSNSSFRSVDPQVARQELPSAKTKHAEARMHTKTKDSETKYFPCNLCALSYKYLNSLARHKAVTHGIPRC